MIISVQILKGETSPVEIEASETVLALKGLIISKRQLDAQPEGLKILFKGKVLANDSTLEASGIHDGDFVVVMVSKTAAQTASALAPAAAAPAPTLPAPTPIPAAPAPGQDAPAPIVAPLAAASATPAPAAPAVDGNAATVQQLCDMGFDRQQVERCLRAAFGNAERAVEYLMTGIPEGVGPQQQAPPAQTHPPARPPAPAMPTVGAPQPRPVATGPLAKLKNSPQFPRLRTAVQNNPSILCQVLAMIHDKDPSLIREIAEHQEEFIEALKEDTSSAQQDPVSAMMAAMQAAQPGQGGAAPVAPPAPQPQPQPTAAPTQSLSAEEEQAIGRLTTLGFSRQQCVQAYLASDKNEELAANYLFDGMEEPQHVEDDDEILDSDEDVEDAD